MFLLQLKQDRKEAIQFLLLVITAVLIVAGLMFMLDIFEQAYSYFSMDCDLTGIRDSCKISTFGIVR